MNTFELAFASKVASLKEKTRAKERFHKVKQTLKSGKGVMVGAHPRVAIPKSALSEHDIKHHLGFVPVKIAIPEQGQVRFTSFRHPDHNYHIHDHGTHWTMHRDQHAAATMTMKKIFMRTKGKAQAGAKSGAKKARGLGHAIKEKARLGGQLAKATVGGIPHVATEGAPGLFYYLKGRATGAGSTAKHVLQHMDKKEIRRMARWRPSMPGHKKKASVQDYAARMSVDGVRQVAARLSKLKRPAIKTQSFRPAMNAAKPTVVGKALGANAGFASALKGSMKTAMTPKEQLVARVGEKANGVTLKRDNKGWYVATHRARSPSYPTIDAIPVRRVEFVESTG